jgi:hypothetical protein
MVAMRAFLPLSVVWWLGACAAPGVAVHPEASDFAFFEIKLRG